MFHYDQGVKRVRTFVINVKQGCLTSFRKWQSGMMTGDDDRDDDDDGK